MPSPSTIFRPPSSEAYSFALAMFSFVRSPVTTTKAGSASDEVNWVARSLTCEDSAVVGRNAELSFSCTSERLPNNGPARPVTVSQMKTTATAKNVNFFGALTFLTLTLPVAVFFLTAFRLCFGLAAGLTYFTPSCV